MPNRKRPISDESAYAYHTKGSAARNIAAAVNAPVRQPAPPQVRPQPQIQPQPQRQPQQRQQAQAAPSRVSRFWLLYTALLLCAAFLLGQVVAAYSELTVLAVENAAMQNNIEALQKEQSALGLVQNERISLAQIEAIAQDELGMVKLSNHNVSLLQSEEPERFVVTARAGQESSIAAAIWTKLQEGARLIWRFIN